MARRLAFIALFVALAAHVVSTLGVVPAPERSRTCSTSRSRSARCALIPARALAVQRNRAAWALIAPALALLDRRRPRWTLARRWSAPFPTRRRALPAMFARSTSRSPLLLRDRVRPFPAWLTIDGLLAGPRRSPRSPRPRSSSPSATRPRASADAVALTLANLVCDLLLLVVVLVGFAATGWRPGRAAGGCSAPAWSPARSPTRSTSSRSRPHLRRRHLARQPVARRGVASIALAAWQRTVRPTRAHVGWAMAASRSVGSAVAIATLLAAGLTARPPADALPRRRRAVRRARPRGADAGRELPAARNGAPRGAHRQAHRAAEPARARARPRRGCRRPPAHAGVLRPRRLQGLQRRLRPPRRRRAARPARPALARVGGAPTGSAATSSACSSTAPLADDDAARSRAPSTR